MDTLDSYDQQLLKLRDWIDESKLDVYELHNNTNAINLLYKYADNDELNIEELNYNKNACELLSYYFTIHKAPYVILKKKYDNINWSKLYENVTTTDLIKHHKGFSFDLYMNKNKNYNIFQYYMSLKDSNKNYKYLSLNPFALDILKKKKDKISWNNLCMNTNPEAMELIKEKIEQIKRNENTGYTEDTFTKNVEQFKVSNQFYFIVNNSSLKNYSGLLLDNIKLNNISILNDMNIICDNDVKNNSQDVNQLNYCRLSANYNAIDLLEEYPEKICLLHLCSNENPRAIKLVEKNLDKMTLKHWNVLCKNSNAYNLIKNNIDKCTVHYVVDNKKSEIRDLIKPYIQDKKRTIATHNDLRYLHNIHDILMLNMETVDMNLMNFYSDINPSIIDDYFDGVENIYSNMSSNVNIDIIEYLKYNQEKIDWYKFSRNPSIFTYDYDKIKAMKHDINKDFIEWMWKPINMNKWNY